MERIDYLVLIGSADTQVNQVQFVHDQVAEDDLFVATMAYGKDHHQYIDSAIDHGASVIVCQKLPQVIRNYVTYIKVIDSLSALAIIAGNYYDNPTRKLKVVGVTGTNGKSSTVNLLHQIFSKLGYHSGLISTIHNKIKDRIIPTNKTTPHALDIHRLCRQMVDQGCEYCFMEVSSHGIHQRRIDGINFTGAIFTNITHDHLDYHGTFDEYFKVKKSFLDHLEKSAFVLYNNDDPDGVNITKDVQANCRSWSLLENVDFRGKVLINQVDQLVIMLDGREVSLKLRAGYNAYNVVGAYAGACLLGLNQTQLLDLLPELEPVTGRFDLIENGGITTIVDYAHNPDALRNLYVSLVEMSPQKIITVIGCGGNRDQEKRPKMAEIARQNSDFLILTSDNPRDENPQDIINDMLTGIASYREPPKIILDRKAAIEFACSIAKRGDLILVAGKGHEKYQEIHGVKHPFDDKAILTNTLSSSS